MNFYIIKQNSKAFAGDHHILDGLMFKTFAEAQEEVYHHAQILFSRSDNNTRLQWFGSGFYIRDLEVEQNSPFAVIGGSLEIHRITTTKIGAFHEAECYQEWHNSLHPFMANNYLDVPMTLEGTSLKQLGPNYNQILMSAIERFNCDSSLDTRTVLYEHALTQPYKFYIKDDQLWMRMLMGGQFSYGQKTPDQIKADMIGQLEDGWLENGVEINEDSWLWPDENLERAHWVDYELLGHNKK